MRDPIQRMKLERDLDTERREVSRLREKVRELQGYRLRVKELEQLLAESYVMPRSFVSYLKKHGLSLPDLSTKVSLFIQGEKNKRKETK